LPNGNVEIVYLSSDGATGNYFGSTTVKAGSSFSFEYNPTTSGTYIVEINDESGLPIVNHPIYIGNIIPLIPDFFDLNQRTLYNESTSKSTLRQTLLNLVNTERKKAGLNPIELNDELTTLAQAHTDDMSANNYFSHVNLDNETPEDRRIEAGILTPVSENIAKDVSIEFAHSGLMRSAAHRLNILTDDWTQVGIGVTIDNGYIYISQEFSTDQLTDTLAEEHKQELLDEINLLRLNFGLDPLDYETNLQEATEYLNSISSSGTTITQEMFSNTLDTYDITSQTTAIGRSFNIWSEILDSLIYDPKNTETFKNPNWNWIGIDIQTDSLGNLHVLTLISQ